MRKSLLLTSVAAVVFLTAVGCEIFSSGVKAFEDMSPKERSLWLMSVYNKEYAEYQAKAQNPELSEEERVIMRLKKAAMQKAWPLLKAYTSMINSGVLSEETEQAAFRAIEGLLGIGGGPDG